MSALRPPLSSRSRLRMAAPLCLCAVVLMFAGCAALLRAYNDMLPKPNIESIVSPDMAKTPPKTIFIQEDTDKAVRTQDNANFYQIIVAEFQKAVILKGYSQTEDINAADAVLKVKIVQIQIQAQTYNTAASTTTTKNGTYYTPASSTTDYTAVVKIQASMVNKAGTKLWIGTGQYDTSIPGGTAVADVIKRVSSDLASYLGLNAAEEKAKQEAAEAAKEKAAEGK